MTVIHLVICKKYKSHQEEENEVELNLPGRKGLEDWWEKRD